MQQNLFSTLGNIGDVAPTTPVLGRLRRCCPETVIDILTTVHAPGPEQPQCAWIIAADQNLNSPSAHSVAKRQSTLLDASANARHH